jgi:hypothetical protein
MSTSHFLPTSDRSAVSFSARTISRRTGYLSVGGREKNSASPISIQISAKDRVSVTNIPGLPSSISVVVTKRARRCLSADEKVSNSSNSLFLCHVLNIPNASALEIRVLELVIMLGLPTVERIAAIFHWRCQRPLRALRAMMNGRARNYSERSAKRKQLLGSSASLKKRSSNE